MSGKVGEKEENGGVLERNEGLGFCFSLEYIPGSESVDWTVLSLHHVIFSACGDSVLDCSFCGRERECIFLMLGTLLFSSQEYIVFCLFSMCFPEENWDCKV